MTTDASAAGRPLRRTAPAPPVRVVHLGLGNFFRAHQAWYTHHANQVGDPQAGGPWGIAAFTGRRPDLAQALSAQDGLYTLDVRGPGGDHLEVIDSVVAPHAAAEHDAWLRYLADPAVRVLTSTVTEAAYAVGADGGPDLTRDDVVGDLETLRRDPGARVMTVPARIVAGLLARRRADAGPIAVVPCDNLPHNGDVVRDVVLGLAERLDPDLRAWAEQHVRWVTTMVDRITPEPTDADVALVRRLSGVDDRAPVVTEPFSEWVLSGDLSAGAPDWRAAGATLTDDVTPFETRKLWLLNGAHSLLAYAAPTRGHETVADAIADDVVRGWVEQWWDEASAHLIGAAGPSAGLSADEVAAYRRALADRFANPAIRHRLAQIAADGSQKIAVRILPTLRLERSVGRMPPGAVRVVAAWLVHLRGRGAPVNDPRGAELTDLAAGPLHAAARRVLGAIGAEDLAADDDLVSALADTATQL